MKNKYKLIKYIFIAIVIINSSYIFKYFYNIYSNDKLLKNIKKTYKNATNSHKNKFDELVKKNPDFVGWLKINNTNINFPVVQGKDNKFYLDKDFYKKNNNSGSIFMDYKNKITNNIKNRDKNIIFYGHNMKSNTMFAELNKFTNKNFFMKNKYITFNTRTENLKFEIFSVYKTKSTENYRKINFVSEKQHENFLNKIKNNSLLKKNISLTHNDFIITLSTCAYDFDDARLVLHAKLIKEKILK
ncbi:class B sortase [Clostridium oceanicum]|uniref:Sortase SrtB n=1 Tax=Clostridium oceanicum TaxID=1543 RepID=A0ABN1JG67_9CLOT